MDDIERLRQELSVMKKVNQAIRYAPDIKAVASAILDIVIEETAAENASIMMPSFDKTCLEIRAARGARDLRSRYSEDPIGDVFSIGEGIAGMVALSKEPIIITDTREDPLFQSRDIKVKIGSMLSIPLLYGDKELVGVLNLSHSVPEVFTESDLSLLDVLVHPAALALRNARTMSDIEDINKMLREDLSMTDRALEEFGRKIFKIFNYMSIGILTVSPDGVITTINKKAVELFHLKSGDNIREFIDTDIINDAGPEMKDRSIDVSLHGRVLNLELAILPLKPTWQTLICVRDVSAERFKEKELTRVKDQYKDMVENAIDAVYIIRDGRFLLTNKKLQEMLGYDAENFLNRHFRHFVTLGSIKTITEALRSRQGNIFIPNLEIQGIKKDGRRLDLEISIGRLIIEDRPCFVGVVRDITSKKELLSLKSRFLNIASHEIRAPLTVIKGYASMLSKVGENNFSSEQRDFISEIQRHCGKLLEFSNSLLDFARLNSDKIKMYRHPLNILDLIRHTIRDLQIRANDKGVSLILESDQDIPEVYIDPIRIEQALTNLVDNAIKYSPRGDTVHIRVNHIKSRETKSISDLFAHGRVVISIMDQGPGIKPEEARSLFSEFYVGEVGRAKGGIGLGLAITREIIHAHGGEVWAETSNKGGHFVVTIPLSPQDN
ncbi:MAG: GAF domain-containing protein [Deltaproteobacteria bacterium]|nr:GAF domain-containing protein [Deltaproteobacteria bacterium]